MVEFKSWKDCYLFLKRYNKYTCLQCRHYNQELDDNKTYKDVDYVRFFCPNQMTMVRLDFQQCCREWENKDGLKITEVGEDYLYTFSEEVADTLAEMEEKVSIKDIEDMIEIDTRFKGILRDD